MYSVGGGLPAIFGGHRLRPSLRPTVCPEAEVVEGLGLEGKERLVGDGLGVKDGEAGSALALACESDVDGLDGLLLSPGDLSDSTRPVLGGRLFFCEQGSFARQNRENSA